MPKRVGITVVAFQRVAVPERCGNTPGKQPVTIKVKIEGTVLDCEDAAGAPECRTVRMTRL